MNDDPNALTDDDFDRLRDERGRTDRDFVQIRFVANVVSGDSRVTNAFDGEFEPVYHDGPWLLPDRS